MKRFRAIRSKVALALSCGIAALASLGALAPPSYGQGSRKDDVVFNAQGRPMAGATVRVCTAAATGQPCSPLANIYSDAGLTQALANPLSTDGLGNYTFYAAPGRYEIEIDGPGIATKQLPNVILPNDPSTPTFTSLSTTSGITAFSLSLSGNLTVTGSAAVTGSLTVGGSPVPSTGQANSWAAPQTFTGGLLSQGPSPWWRDVTAAPYNGCLYPAADIPTATPYGHINASSTVFTNDGYPTRDWAGLANGCGVFIPNAGPTATVAAPALGSSSGAYNSGTTYSVSQVVTYGGNTYYSLVNSNTGNNPQADYNTYGGGTGAHWFPVVIQQGPCQELVTQTAKNCGSVTYTYAFASVDKYGAWSAATPQFSTTVGAQPQSDEVVITHADWTASTSYTAGNVVRFQGQFYISEQNSNAGNTPFQNPTYWGALEDSWNYVWLSGPLATGAEGYAIWRKTRTGSWQCLVYTYNIDDSGGERWHYEDHGNPNSLCPQWVPTSPPASAGNDPLITTVVSHSGATWNLANAATNSVSNVFFEPDNSVALSAALTQAVTDINGGGPGSPNILIPAGGLFYLSRANVYDMNGNAYSLQGTIHLTFAGSPIFYNMPFLLDVTKLDIEGIGGGGSGTPGLTPVQFENSTGFVIGDPAGGFLGESPDGVHIHGFTAGSTHYPLITITGQTPSSYLFDNLAVTGADYNSIMQIGGNVITWAVRDFTFDASYSDYGLDAIVISPQEGGSVTNTFAIGNPAGRDEIEGKAILKTMAPIRLANGGGCSITDVNIYKVLIEGTVSPGVVDQDSTTSDNEGCGLGPTSDIYYVANADPLVAVSTLYASIEPYASGVEVEGNASSGPTFSHGYYDTPAPTTCSDNVLTVNSGSPIGVNHGCTALTTMVPGGFETDGMFYARQPGDTIAAPSHVLVAADHR